MIETNRYVFLEKTTVQNSEITDAHQLICHFLEGAEADADSSSAPDYEDFYSHKDFMVNYKSNIAMIGRLRIFFSKHKADETLTYNIITVPFFELYNLIKAIDQDIRFKRCKETFLDRLGELHKLSHKLHMTGEFVLSQEHQAKISESFYNDYEGKYSKILNDFKELRGKSFQEKYFSELGTLIEKKERHILKLNIGIWVLALVLGGFAIGSYLGIYVEKISYLWWIIPDFDLDFVQPVFNANYLYQILAKILAISPFIFLTFLMVRQLRKEEILCEGYRYKASTMALFMKKELELSADIKDEKFAQILLHNPLDVLNDDTPKLSLEDIKTIKGAIAESGVWGVKKKIS